MQMSHKQVRFFIGRLSLFLNRSKMSKLLGVSYPTIIRWQKGETLPNMDMMTTFQDALEHLVQMIDEHSHAYGKWARDIADIVEDETPKWENPALPKWEHAHVIKLVRDMLKDGHPVLYKDIEREAEDKGFTRSQVQYAGKRLKVVKEAIGKGRNAYSLWRLLK